MEGCALVSRPPALCSQEASLSLSGVGVRVLLTHPGGVYSGTHPPRILLPSARHLEEGRGTTFFEVLRRENCISRLCPRPLGRPAPQHPNRVKNT